MPQQIEIVYKIFLVNNKGKRLVIKNRAIGYSKEEIMETVCEAVTLFCMRNHYNVESTEFSSERYQN